MAQPTRAKAAGTAALTAAAMVAFAANSLLCRDALATARADATSFTALRLASGALLLNLLVRGRRSRDAGARLQVTMLAGGLLARELPPPREWLGLALALAGLVVLTRPGWGQPDPAAAALMLGAGVAWGIYSLRGRAEAHPLAANARSFLRAVPFAAVAWLAAAGLSGPPALSPSGAVLAVASGALASGLGYALWYAALPRLRAAQAAVVQLSVPPLAAIGGILFLAERPSARLAIAAAGILGGIALALTAPRRASSPLSGPEPRP